MNAVSLYRAGAWLRRRNLVLFATLVDALVYLVFNCVIPSHAVIGRGTRAEHRGVGIVINRKAIIGENCSIGPHVVIGGRGKNVAGTPLIGDGVYLAAGCKVLGGVKIGDNAVVGANAVVLSDIPAGATAVGVPARTVKLETD